jgi:hypothetical protein
MRLLCNPIQRRVLILNFSSAVLALFGFDIQQLHILPTEGVCFLFTDLTKKILISGEFA